MSSFTWPFAIIVAIIAGLAIYFNEHGADGLRRSIEPITEIASRLVNLKSGAANENDFTSISFWTPSEETAEAWRAFEVGGKVIPAKDLWESKVGQVELDAFEKSIGSLPGFAGFRRMESVGKGRGEVKPGYWWTVTTSKKFDFASLRNSYEKLCGCDDAYFEFVSPNRTVYDSLMQPKP